MLSRPRERAIEMAQVAGVGPPGRYVHRDARTADAVCADGFQQSEGGVRHVAVGTTAALGRTRMVGVGAAVALRCMTPHTGGVADSVRPQLIVRSAGVHGVAIQAGQVATPVALRGYQSAVLAAGHPYFPVAPEALLEESGRERWILAGAVERSAAAVH